MLKSLGFLSWIACLAVLACQSAAWVVSGSWPHWSLFTALRALFGFDLLAVLDSLSLETVAKLLYVALTTELSLFFWWLGVAMFGLMLIIGLARK